MPRNPANTRELHLPDNDLLIHPAERLPTPKEVETLVKLLFKIALNHSSSLVQEQSPHELANP